MASLQTRTVLLTKFIEVARALQGPTYGDVFGFMAIMTGLNSVQVSIPLLLAACPNFLHCPEEMEYNGANLLIRPTMLEVAVVKELVMLHN